MSLPKLFVFVVLVLTSLFLGKSVAAQVPNPYVDCDDVRPDLLHPLSDEFHSLRPYQASPCNTNISGAAFCGNGIRISEQVSETQSDSPSNASNQYISDIKEIYRWLSPAQKFPCYPSRVSQ